MRLRIILLWGLFVSCVQLRAQDWQEIGAKFNSQPVITISDGTVKIKFDYSFYGEDENVKFKYAIFDSNGKKVSDKNFDINGMSYHNPLIFDYQNFEGYKSPFYLSATICWNYLEGEYFELATTEVTPFSLNISSSNASTSSSSDTHSKYTALSDQNLVDNSEEIKEQENHIKELEYKKQHCYLCHGTGKTQKNCTMCFLGWSGYGKYKHPCTFCGGTGKVDDYCSECRYTNMAISFAEQQIKTLKETHGMAKETADFYYSHQNKMAEMDRDYQNTINAIAEPYLNSTRKSNSSHSSTSSSPKCSMCNGTGIDPHAYHSGDPKPAVGGYTHSSGGKCIYCGKYEWHQHVYCPKCNANKYP